MTAAAELTDLFVGPAVVVDDKIRERQSGIRAILEQITAAHIPVMELETLPELEQIRHWGSLSMIVLDWELFPDSDGPPNLPPGVALPEALIEDNSQRLVEFIEAVLSTVYCPIFIFSSQSVDAILADLQSRLTIDQARWRTRVLVRSKDDVQSTLFAELSHWVTKHPAVYVLKSWENSYEQAKRSLFADFESSSASWPNILWKTSAIDSVNPHFELAETVSRNLLHRMNPLFFDGDLLSESGGEPDPGSLHRVLHGQAVIPGANLHSDVVMPGDFFYKQREDGGPPKHILINLTPSCDLVPREGRTLDDLRLQFVRADMIEAPSKSNKIDAFLSRDSPSEQLLHHLTNGGVPYRVNFKNTFVQRWRAVKNIRQGRLLDPYVTQLQQKNALHLHRQGLPRIPQTFYLPEE